MKNPTPTIIACLICLLLGFMACQIYNNIDNSIPDNLVDKYTNKKLKFCIDCPDGVGVCEEKECKPCPVCVPYAEITGGKLYCDSSRYLETIKALNFRISDLKSCISEECLNFSSMPSKCK